MAELESTKKYSIKEVAKITGVTVRTVWNYLKDGRLRGEKLGNRWRFSKENIENLYKAQNIRCKFEKMQNCFLEKFNKVITSAPYSCYICSYPSKKIKDLNSLRAKILKNLNKLFKLPPDFFYHYNYEKKCSEFILIGTPLQVQKMNKIIIEYIQNRA